MTPEPEPRPSVPPSSAEGKDGGGRTHGLFRPRQRVLIAAGVAAILLAVAFGVWPRRPGPVVLDPPLPDLTGADREVADLVQAARQEVLREPSSAAAWGHLGKALLAHDFNREANRCFQQAELLAPREPAWPYLQGLNLVLHDPEAGIPCLERAVQRCADGQNGPRLFLAEVLLDRGRLDEGQSLLEQVLQAQPDNLRARLGFGRLALLRQDWRAGLARLESCQSDAHTRKRAHALRAEAWNQLGETERARGEQHLAAELPADRAWPDPYYEEALKLRKGLRPRFQAVNYLLQTGQVSQAIQLLDETLERYPQSLEAWMRLGEVWQRAKKLDKALTCYRQAVRLAPDLAEGWFRLGCVQAVGHKAEAVASFREAIRCKPNNAQAHYNLGQCLKELGDHGGAEKEFREALRCRPDFDLARTALRDLKAEAGKTRKEE